MKNNLGNREKDVEELRVEALRQSEHYEELWKAHGALLEEAQTLRSQVIILNSGGRVESIRGWLGNMSRDLEGPSSRPGDSGRQSGRPADHAESSGGWHRRSWRWSKDQGSGWRWS